MSQTPDGGTCKTCKGKLELIDWCEPENMVCEQDCGNNLEDKDCMVMEERLRCERCGIILEVQ